MSDWPEYLPRTFWSAWPFIFAHNLMFAAALRKERLHGWWDGTGYHLDEVKEKRIPKSVVVARQVAWTGGTPGVASLGRAA